jgi:hypothetical protein
MYAIFGVVAAGGALWAKAGTAAAAERTSASLVARRVRFMKISRN